MNLLLIFAATVATYFRRNPANDAKTELATLSLEPATSQTPLSTGGSGKLQFTSVMSSGGSMSPPHSQSSLAVGVRAAVLTAAAAEPHLSGAVNEGALKTRLTSCLSGTGGQQVTS